MKKILLLLPFLFAGQQALALDSQDEEDYKQHYIEQMKPLALKQIGTNSPDMSADEIKIEANTYVNKMAECQLESMEHFPKRYREKAIMPVAQGEDVREAVKALDETIQQDIDQGKVSKQEIINMAQTAQEKAQACAAS